MEIATIKGSANRPGKKITFDAGCFSVEGLGPVEVDAVVELDRQGRLTWSSDPLRAWALAQVPGRPVVGPPPGGAPAPTLPINGSPARPQATPVTASPLAPAPLLSVATGWTSRCPACGQGALRAGEPKKSFWSQTTRQVWVCPQCRATFVEKGPGYELRDADAAGAQTLQRFREKTLTTAEWVRVAGGGQSDAEIAVTDLQLFLDAVLSGNARLAASTDVPVTLKGGEAIIAVCSKVTLREPRTVTQGIYGGPRIRVSRTLSFNLGGFRAAPHEELRDVDSGNFVLTDQRYIFMGSKRTATASLSMIVGVEPYEDAFAIHRSNKQRMEMFCGLGHELFSYNFEGRSHTAPLNGAVVAYLIEGLGTAGPAMASAPAASQPKSKRGAGSTSAGSTASEIERLVKLHDRGDLTDAEFAALKAKLIRG